MSCFQILPYVPLYVLVLTAEFVAIHWDQHRASELGLCRTLIRYLYAVVFSCFNVGALVALGLVHVITQFEVFRKERLDGSC